MKYLFIFILMLTLFTREFLFFHERHIYMENETFEISYSFNHEPKKNSMSQYFFVDGVLVTTTLYPSYHYGDKVEIQGTVKKKTVGNKELLVVGNPTMTKVEEGSPVISISKFVRSKVEDAVIHVLPAKEAGLLLGIILGVRDKIDSEYYAMLKNSGVLHVVAASGQNVSIAAVLLLTIFMRIVRRKMALLITAIGVITYATLTGFDPPIVRASIMAILTFSALFSGRQVNSVYILILTGWGMLMYQPQELIDVSFQLSFLSTFGIVTLKPLLDRVLTFRFVTLFKEDITTTLSAQVATFPLMISVFGSYSLLSFPINIMILWTVPVIMVAGGAGALLSLLATPSSVPFILICYPFLTYFTNVVVFFSSFSYQLNVGNTPFLVVIGYYLILLGIVIRFHPKKPKKL